MSSKRDLFCSFLIRRQISFIFDFPTHWLMSPKNVNLLILRACAYVKYMVYLFTSAVTKHHKLVT
jgi:hypothetical protein